MDEFDYIVVGGGSAGCTLAGRLSEDPDVSVCLVEAGGHDNSVLIRAPLGFAVGAPIGLHTSRYESLPQAGLGGRRSFQPRGKVLGGSSSINAMVFVRGNRSDFDHWASLGNPGWDYAGVLPYFKRLENCEALGADEYRGVGGPLNVAWLRSPSPLNDAFLAACESAGVNRTPDCNGATQDGCWPAQVTQVNGERCNAFRAYVAPHLHRPNLKVLTQAQTMKVRLDGRRATGVQIRVGNEIKSLRARREVVLCAGAFGSPQLLVASGIGPGADLQHLGIAVAHDSHGVGLNLQDHITATLIWRSRYLNGSMGLSARGGWDMLQGIFEWRKHRTGPISSNVAESGAFFRTRADAPAPEIELEFVVGIVDDHNRKMHLGHGYSLHVTLLRPKSRGHVKFSSPDPGTPPVIDNHFFSHPDDMRTLVEGTRKALHIMNATPLAHLRGRLMYPVDMSDPVDVERDIRRSADAEYHPVGTCRMGPAGDRTAVVDPELRVHGIDCLRVADASIMPTITSGNTNAPTIMIGEKAVDLLRASRR